METLWDEKGEPWCRGNIGLLWEEGSWSIYGTNFPHGDPFGNRFFIKFDGGDYPALQRRYEPLIYDDGIVAWHTTQGRSKIPLHVRHAFEFHAVPAYLKQQQDQLEYFASIGCEVAQRSLMRGMRG